MEDLRKINTEVGEIAIRGSGRDRGKPPVLFIPDYGDVVSPENALWSSPLADGYALVAVDPLGTGWSAQPMSARYTIDDHCTSIYQVLTSFDVRLRWSLVGFGAGFCLAVALHHAYPNLLSHIIGVGVGGIDPRSAGGRAPISSNIEQFLSAEFPLWLKRAQRLANGTVSSCDKPSGMGVYYTLQNVHAYIRSGAFLGAVESSSIPVTWIVPQHADVSSEFFNSELPNSLTLVQIPCDSDNLMSDRYKRTLNAIQVALGVGGDWIDE